MNSYGLIFVLYEPTEEFLDNLARARAFCPNMVAVDNSPEADLRLHDFLREQGIQLILNRNKGGLAGAYNRGAEVLLEQNCEVIFLLDQDSDIDALFFENMMRACRELGTDEFLVGPKIYEINLEKCMPVFQPGKYLPKRLRIDDQNEGMFPSLCIISSGSAISAAAYRKLGPFREDYFIEYIDIEYSLRAVSHSVPVYMNAAVTMRQTTGKIERHGDKYTTNHVAWRRYYGARNAVHCLYLHRESWGLHWVSGLLAFLQVLRVLQYEPQKLKKITAITCGYLDGLFGLLGTFEDRHPRIAAFCKRSAPTDSDGQPFVGKSDRRRGMRRKLSAIEHMIDGNIVYFVRLEGSFDPERLRQALGRVQRKHPALRTLICKERDGLYYEEDCAPEVPLRVLRRIEEDDFRRETQLELTTVFAFDRPQLRAVMLQSQRETDLLLVTSHRICDGMSMLTLVREVLRALHKDEDLIPYTPITTSDMIGDYQPPQPWKRKLTARLVNGFTRLIPHSRRAPDNKEHCLEWAADRALSDTLKQRCKAEGVSIHAALVVALDRALFTVLGKKKAPALIESPMDARRGRLAALKSDMLFFGGGSLVIPTGQALQLNFWERAREIHEQIRRDIEKEMLKIPGRYHFAEMLRPLPSAQMQSMVRLGDALKMNGSWNRFALSNLGNVVVSDNDAPFRVKDLRLYVHSFNIRLLGLVAYALNGEMRFYFVSDEKCLSSKQAAALKREFMALLRQQLIPAEESASEALLVSRHLPDEFDPKAVDSPLLVMRSNAP